jgi:hypothetical protein
MKETRNESETVAYEGNAPWISEVPSITFLFTFLGLTSYRYLVEMIQGSYPVLEF